MMVTDDRRGDIGEYLMDIFRDAKELGSIITVQPKDYDGYIAYLNSCNGDGQLALTDNEWIAHTRPALQALAEQAKVLSGKYTVVCTNPPYLNKMGGELKKKVIKDYKDYAGDLFSVFIYRNLMFCEKNGYCGYMTPNVWMFIKSYEKLRKYAITTKQIVTLVQMSKGAFFKEATVDICSFVLENTPQKANGLYIRLEDFKGGMEVQKQKVLEALADKNCGYFYEADQSNFSKIPGAPVAYWASPAIQNAFAETSLYSLSSSPSQNVTGNNDRYVRKHWELPNNKIGSKDAWIFYAKGGGFRKWWGNLTDVVDWTPEARQIYQFGDGKHASQIINKEYWYKKGITWGLITSALPSFRIMPDGATYDKGGSTIIVDENVYSFVLGLLNSCVYLEIASMLNPTLNFQVKDVRSMPLILKRKEEIEKVVGECVKISKGNWDSYETSWDFKWNPLVRGDYHGRTTTDY